MSDKEKNKKQVNEPGANYSPPKKLGEVFKTITVSSFEEMDYDRRKYSAFLSPEERMAYLFELNKLAFGILSREERQKRFEKRILIKKQNNI